MKKLIIAIILIILIAMALIAYLLVFPIQQAQVKRSLIRKHITVIAEGKTRTIGFYRFTPAGTTTEKHPVIIYLHGIGERGFNGTTGTDINTVSVLLRQPIPKLLPTGSMQFGNESFIVIAPQLSTEFNTWRTWYVTEMLKYIKRDMPEADTNRIYLTGMSLGGGGVYDALEVADIVRQLAAAAVVCGTCRLTSTDAIVKYGLPLWLFHAQDDPTVSVGCTNTAYTNLLKADATLPLEKTIYATGGHGIWTRAYDTLNPSYRVYGNDLVKQLPNLYEWFLQFSKNRKKGWNEWENDGALEYNPETAKIPLTSDTVQ